ncbi:nitroreductase family deazaflavin-dependent oxidoreductase [Phycicoccus sp. MQZ13P-5]|uniref:Nitroreductase family deazaflavin-dependent oxidoreductase n=2 Tax=Phycicoccus sonneratiae TaxID=2807628 RepID=A0ABS2CMG7_9MICO|nr:nitroreductase family deazaflavin-dependent oxidoreductase [Phycicoccus sonneraticus]
MYVGGRGNAAARRWSRAWVRLIGSGLGPRRWATLEVLGRRSGEVRRFPLGLADVGEDWYAVSMLGECAWTRNVRAASGEVVLRGRGWGPVRFVEVPVAERAPVLRRYVEKVPGGRPHVPVRVGAPLADFAAVAPEFPVFRVTRR